MAIAACVLALAVHPAAAQEPPPEPRATGGPTVQRIEAGVWRIVSDGAGNHLGRTWDALALDSDGRLVLCCADGRVAGEEVRQVIRFGDPEPVASLDPYGRVYTAHGMAVAPDGTIWVAGQGGLASHDGTTWTEHRLARRASASEQVIGFDADGATWVEFSNGREWLGRFSDGAWSLFREGDDVPRATGLPNGEVTDIESTPDGSVWFAVAAEGRKRPGGLARFDGTTWQAVFPLGRKRPAAVEGLAVDADGRLWAYLSTPKKSGGWTSHLVRRDGEDWAVFGQGDGVPRAGRYDPFNRLYVEAAPDGRIWFTSRSGFGCAGLGSFDVTGVRRHMGDACVGALAIAPDGAAIVSATYRADDRPLSGLFAVAPDAEGPYPAGASVVAAPDPNAGLFENIEADYRLRCASEAVSDDARTMCDLVAPDVIAALRTAVDFCGGEDAEGDAAAWCLALMAPMIVDSMAPPPWREDMDIGATKAYREIAARHQAPPDELDRISRLGDAEARSRWTEAAARDDAFADAIIDLDMPADARILAGDAAARFSSLAATERELAADPADVEVIVAYRQALASARASDTDLRWVLGLPPSIETAVHRFRESFDEEALDAGLPDPDAPAPEGARSRAPVSLVEGRSGHTATLMPDGRVIVLGGAGSSGRGRKSMEIFDPATKTFTDGPSTRRRRGGHAVVGLPDGTLLLLDGVGRARIDASVFDPESGRERDVGSPKRVYAVDAATSLPDGRVLVVGSVSGAPGEVFLYEAGADRLAATGQTLEGHSGGTATTLEDGSVLIVGGTIDQYTDPGPMAETFDIGTTTTTTTGPMVRPRSSHSATRLHDGTVLIAGGGHDLALFSAAELYDPVSRSFSPVGSLNEPRSGHTATLLDDGSVLIVGGRSTDPFAGLATAERYDPVTRRFEVVGRLRAERVAHTATRMADGRVLIVGGESSSRSAEVYDPETRSFTPVPAAAGRSDDEADCTGMACFVDLEPTDVPSRQ